MRLIPLPATFRHLNVSMLPSLIISLKLEILLLLRSNNLWKDEKVFSSKYFEILSLGRSLPIPSTDVPQIFENQIQIRFHQLYNFISMQRQMVDKRPQLGHVQNVVPTFHFTVLQMETFQVHKNGLQLRYLIRCRLFNSIFAAN